MSHPTLAHEACAIQVKCGTPSGTQSLTAEGRPKAAFAISKKDLENGAGEGIRTLDPNLGKVVLYP